MPREQNLITTARTRYSDNASSFVRPLLYLARCSKSSLKNGGESLFEQSNTSLVVIRGPHECSLPAGSIDNGSLRVTQQNQTRPEGIRQLYRGLKGLTQLIEQSLQSKFLFPREEYALFARRPFRGGARRGPLPQLRRPSPPTQWTSPMGNLDVTRSTRADSIGLKGFSSSGLALPCSTSP